MVEKKSGGRVSYVMSVGSLDQRVSAACPPQLVTSQLGHKPVPSAVLSAPPPVIFSQLQLLGSSQKNKTINKDRTRRVGAGFTFFSLWLFNCSPAVSSGVVSLNSPSEFLRLWIVFYMLVFHLEDFPYLKRKDYWRGSSFQFGMKWSVCPCAMC